MKKYVTCLLLSVFFFNYSIAQIARDLYYGKEYLYAIKQVRYFADADRLIFLELYSNGHIQMYLSYKDGDSLLIKYQEYYYEDYKPISGENRHGYCISEQMDTSFNKTSNYIRPFSSKTHHIESPSLLFPNIVGDTLFFYSFYPQIQRIKEFTFIPIYCAEGYVIPELYKLIKKAISPKPKYFTLPRSYYSTAPIIDIQPTSIKIKLKNKYLDIWRMHYF